MKSSIHFTLYLAFVLGLSACQSLGLGPKQDSQISFDYVDEQGEPILTQRSFTLDQTSPSRSFSSDQSPTTLGVDSIWVARSINFNHEPLNTLDSLNYNSLGLTFYQKELKSLLVEDEECKCFNYPDDQTFMDRFWREGMVLNENQKIYATYTFSFSLFYTDIATDPNSELSFIAINQKDGAIFMKAEFDIGFGGSFSQIRFSNGEMQVEIPFIQQ